MDDNFIKIIGIFISFISVMTGIFMPLILNIVKRNARNTDEKLSILYTGQENTLKAIQDLELKYNDTKNKTNSNFTAIKETKAIIEAKFENVDKRLNNHSVRSIQNEKDIVEIKTIQKNKP